MAQTSSRSRAIFADYADDRRQSPVDGFTCDVFPHLTRYTPKIDGLEGFVVFARLPVSEEMDLIRNEISYFSELKLKFEWKVYDFDRPANLKSLLEAHNFACGESEAFMTCSHDRQPGNQNLRSRAEIRRIHSDTELRDIVSVQQMVWNQDFSWLVEQLSENLANKPNELSLYCAYVDDEPVGSGWTSFPAKSLFPELHGGAVVPEWRGQGIYGDLYRVRCKEILDRGYASTSVDATNMSRPTLESLGFEFVCMTHPMSFQST